MDLDDQGLKKFTKIVGIILSINRYKKPVGFPCPSLGGTERGHMWFILWMVSSILLRRASEAFRASRALFMAEEAIL